MRKPWLIRISMLAAFGVAISGSVVHAQEKSEVSLSRQPGIFYMPTHIIEKEKLIEKHAAALGLPNVTAKWVTFSGGGAQTDALLAGSVDVLNTGTGNLLLLWDRTKGGVKGIVGTSAQPMTLITREPHINSLKDFKDTDKIAVPTVKVSTQAIVLQIAAAELFGADQWSKLDSNTVQLSHPNAYAALMNEKHEVRTHFSIPPFTFLAMKNVPNARVILRSPDVMGGPLTLATFFTTTKFADANPKIIQAIRGAAKEAEYMIRNDTKKAVEIYKEVTGDKTATEDLLAWLKEPGMMEYNLDPQGTMKFAKHLHKVGTLKTLPKDWTDFYLPSSHDLKGN